MLMEILVVKLDIWQSWCGAGLEGLVDFGAQKAKLVINDFKQMLELNFYFLFLFNLERFQVGLITIS